MGDGNAQPRQVKMIHGERSSSERSSPERWYAQITARAPEASVALAVMLVVGMMVVPLPTVALDLLITANLAMAILLMAAAIYLREGLALAATMASASSLPASTVVLPSTACAALVGLQ